MRVSRTSVVFVVCGIFCKFRVRCHCRKSARQRLCSLALADGLQAAFEHFSHRSLRQTASAECQWDSTAEHCTASLEAQANIFRESDSPFAKLLLRHSVCSIFPVASPDISIFFRIAIFKELTHKCVSLSTTAAGASSSYSIDSTLLNGVCLGATNAVSLLVMLMNMQRPLVSLLCRAYLNIVH